MRRVKFINEPSLFENWKIQYMLDEIRILKDEERIYNSKKSMTDDQRLDYEDTLSLEQKRAFRKAEYDKNLDYYTKTYNKVIEICDKTASFLSEKFKNIIPNIMEHYLDRKERCFYEDIKTYHLEHQWSERAFNVICGLLDIYYEINDFLRFRNFKEKTKFTQYEAEAVIQYMIEKLDIKISLVDSKLVTTKFKKDTLLAMKCINKFASENGITKDDVLELFCEYI
jgi:hypothetical protein